MGVQLIPQWTADVIRRMPRAQQAGWGYATEITASGRAHCRACGQRIKKEAAALVTLYSFDGSALEGNPWCAQAIYIHVECPKEEKHDA